MVVESCISLRSPCFVSDLVYRDLQPVFGSWLIHNTYTHISSAFCIHKTYPNRYSVCVRFVQIVSRGIQGIGAGGLLSLSTVIVGDIVKPSDRYNFLMFGISCRLTICMLFVYM